MKRRALALLIVFGVIAAACSGDDDDSKSRSASAVSSTTTLPELVGTLEVGDIPAPDRCDPIDPRHLAALPTTPYCAPCQQWHEHRAARTH